MASKKNKSGSLSVGKNKKKSRFAVGSAGGLSKLASTAALTALLIEQAYAEQNPQPKELQDEDLLESAEEVAADEIEEVADQTECEKNPESAEQVDASQRTRTEESDDACAAPLRTNSVASTDGDALAKPVEASLGGTNETGTLLGAAAFAPLGIFGGVFGAAVIDTVVFADDTVSVDEIKGRTLKELMDANVSSVIIPSDVRVLTLEFGEGSLTGRSLPIFGDNNLDGALSEGEDSSIEITLAVAGLAQLKELAAFTNLGGSGIDRIQLNVTTQEAVDLLADSADLGGILQALRQQGLSITTIDVQGSPALQVTDAQANALVNNGLVFAGNDQVDLTLNAQNANLDITLKELQKLGVDAVTVSALNSGSGAHQLFVVLGDGVTLTSGALPMFGDVNHDGKLSDAEYAALDVTLNITGQDQLLQLSGREAGLAASGIDHIQMLVANQNDLNALFSSTNSAAVVEQLLGAGLSGSFDMLTNSDVHISQTAANALVDAGLHFAVDDNITFDVNADGTHLRTSLKDLQKLGVDAITLSAQDGGPAIHSLLVGLGDGAALTSGALPMFGDINHNGVLSDAEYAALDVTLKITGQDQLLQLSGREAGLAASGIDHIQMLVANQNDLNALFNSTNSAAVVEQLLGAGLSGSFDMLTNSDVHISQTAANALVDAGLHFAANDNITFDVNAGGTHLSTSLKDLQKLGVDLVHATYSNIQSISLNYGEGAALDLSGNIPHFHSALDVTLHVQNVDDLHALTAMQNQMAAIGIDHLGLLVTQDMQVFSLIENGVNLITGTEVTDQTDWNQILGTLEESGVASVNIQNDADVSLSDDLSAALYEAGMLHALPDANVVIDAGANKLLQTSLKAMVDIGVDGVQTDHKVYVQLGMDLDEVNSLIADFVEQAPTTGLFGEGQAGVLVSEATFSQLSHQDIQTLVGKLSQLGFTEIDLLDSSHVARSVYKITDQTYAPVEVIGAVQADLEDIFGGDILHKKVI